MKPKLLILALCALALASCNNEPEIVLGEDALPAVAMAIIDKPIAEAEDYLVNIHYARYFTGIKKIDNSTQTRHYFRPEEVLKLLNVNNGNTLQEQLQNTLYERLYFNTHEDKLYYTISESHFGRIKLLRANSIVEFVLVSIKIQPFIQSILKLFLKCVTVIDIQ